ncbi:hypothetical protein M441DRAFT_77061 [Trichoderma asperellum CBS 433.97]|uniref:Uncharacterized protein n=3 Tax=Trichoderma asperellum TaxID=101201 RepID=A0A2T3ZGJ5_TRIA4|nr:hypothetical protein M441DRAFT_77061 [Trichoderma asperellum CBS 433.97]PTB43903.1 hypothetical protein M441DRAFT_77061 [Trichoderma asperellum CBS 433.97]
MLMLRSSEPEQNNPEQLEEPKQIHVSCDKTDITWKDGSGRAQSIDNIPFKVDIDTLISKTIFRLSCRVWIKGKGKNRSVYLFIHPENIQNIKLGDDDDVPSLHFSMNQGHSRLVIPSDCILGCKKSAILRYISGMIKLTRHHLQQIASVFSATNINRPETDDRRTDLRTLYNGIRSHVFDAGATLVDKALLEDTSAPPPIDYEPGREHKPQSDLTGLVQYLLDMENCLRNDMKDMVESTETRLKNDLKQVIESTQDCLRDDVKNMIESSENHTVESTENRLKDQMDDILNHMKGLEDTLAADSRADDIERGVDMAVDDLRTECIGTIESEFRYLRYGIEEVTKGMEEAEEKANEVLNLVDEAGDGIERRVGRYLNSIRLQVTVDDE